MESQQRLLFKPQGAPFITSGRPGRQQQQQQQPATNNSNSNQQQQQQHC